MAVLEENQLLEFLEAKSQRDWLDALDALEASIHPVDREATRIWFAFWPLELRDALSAPEGADEMARVMDLEGNWRLAEQIDRVIGRREEITAELQAASERLASNRDDARAALVPEPIL